MTSTTKPVGSNVPSPTPTLQDEGKVTQPDPKAKKTAAFWISFVSIVLCTFLSALDLVHLFFPFIVLTCQLIFSLRLDWDWDNDSYGNG
jgi:hypothetical protein